MKNKNFNLRLYQPSIYLAYFYVGGIIVHYYCKRLNLLKFFRLLPTQIRL